MNRIAEPLAVPPLPTETLRRAPNGGTGTTGRLYHRLLADILHGRLEPGAPLRLTALAASCATSTTTIRQTLALLEHDRLVMSQPVLGYFVAPATQSDLLELIKTLSWLEEIGIRESIRHSDRQWGDRVLAAHRALAQSPPPAGVQKDKSLSAWEENVLACHHALISGCASSLLIAYCRSLSLQMLRYRNLARNVSNAEQPELDGVQFRNAVLNRDVDVTVELLRAHFKMTAEGVLESGAIT